MGSLREALDAKLREVNQKLRRFGVPFDLPRLGNFKEGEWGIEEVLSVFLHRDFLVNVVFHLREPETGRLVEYQGSFNSTYSTEALSGHIIVPIVNGTHFLMMKSYGPFIGQSPLVFPHGFIPKSDHDLTLREVAMAILERKVLGVMPFVSNPEMRNISTPQSISFGGRRAVMAENCGNSGNLVTASEVGIVMDEVGFARRPKKFRHLKLIPIDGFMEFVRKGEILDQHTLSAYVMYLAAR